MPEFFKEAEFWVGVGLVIFLGIVFVGAKAHTKIAAVLDAQAATIQADLDDAARIREEAQRLLAELSAERAAAEIHAKELLDDAKEAARLYEEQAKAKLEESLARRRQISERHIATAEAQAIADVKAAASDLAIQLAEHVLAARLVIATTDPLIDKAIGEIATRMQ